MPFTTASTPSVPRLLALAAAALVASAPAWSATTVYTNQAAFLAAVQPGAYTETFTATPDADLSYSYASGAFAYTVTAPAAGFGDDVYLSGTFIGNYYGGASLTVTFTGGAPTAIGGNFFISDINDAFVPAAPVTITLSDGTVTTFTPGSASDYRGFTSTVAISSLTMSAPAFNLYNTIDNLTVGKAAVAAVPEPGSIALLLAGLGAIGFVSRRRSRG